MHTLALSCFSTINDCENIVVTHSQAIRATMSGV